MNMCVYIHFFSSSKWVHRLLCSLLFFFLWCGHLFVSVSEVLRHLCSNSGERIGGANSDPPFVRLEKGQASE